MYKGYTEYDFKQLYNRNFDKQKLYCEMEYLRKDIIKKPRIEGWEKRKENEENTKT